MSATIEDERKALFVRFSQVETGSAFELIAEILVAWGHKLVELKQIADPRTPAGRFWWMLTSMEFERLSATSAVEDIVLTSAQIESEATTWVGQLVQFPFETMIREFTLAVFDWMRICDLTMFMEEGDSETDGLLALYRQWGAGLGVD